MNRAKQISRALSNIAHENIPEHANLWPQIASNIECQEASGPGLRLKLSWTSVVVLLALITISTAAYAFYRKMIDPGLQGVEDAGLVTDLNQAAKPTVFAELPAPPISTGEVAQTQQGVTVTLNWAYADESRLAMQFTILGLIIPPRVSPEDLICKPLLMSDERVSFGLGESLTEVLEDQPEKPVELTYVFYQPLDASQYDHLDLSLDLTIGPCADYWNFQETNIQKPTPPSLIGNYHLAFRVPVYQGVMLTPNQSIEANGVRMRLERISLNPSFTSLHLCHQRITTVEIDEAVDLIPEAAIQIGDAAPVRSASYQAKRDDARQEQDCTELGFATPYDGQAARVVVTVDRLSLGSVFDVSPETMQSAQGRLARQGIEVEFLTNSTGLDWKVLKKPGGMADADAYQAVYDALTSVAEGPWVFTIEVKP